MAANTLSYSVVIATGRRVKALNETLCDWQKQLQRPKEIVVVGFSSRRSHVSNAVPVEHLHSPVASSALQRNLGAEKIIS